MTAAQVAALFGIWVTAVVSPGPDLVVVLQRSLAGRRHGLATAAGVVTGIAVWLAAAFAGLAALVRGYPQLMTGLQVAGGVLLAYLGVLGLRGWWRSRAGGGDPGPAVLGPDDVHPSPGGRRLPGGGFARGLAANLANPKALVFFGAVLAPFLRGEVPPGQSVLLVAGMIAAALVWFGGIALAASHRGVAARVERIAPTLDLAASALFVVVGVAFVIGAVAGVSGDPVAL